MWFSNIPLSRTFIRISNPLYICKNNLQAAMYNSRKILSLADVRVAFANATELKTTQFM